MCGVSVIVGPSCDRERLAAMVCAQRHRGPDAEGMHIDPNANVGLGHNRLSIIDLTDAADQPFCRPNERRWIVFNGEIYNYLELRRELAPYYQFRTASDTEVLLAAYDRWGRDCLDRLIGMFAFVIWDERRQELFAARDRLGIKPLYYHQEADGTLLFASEIKALHAAGVDAEPDEQTWSTYLATGQADFSARTFWRSIEALAPGCALIWRDGNLRQWRWHDFGNVHTEADDSRDDDEVIEDYNALIHDAVRLRFRSDVPIGVSCSGGLDSSLLLALVAEVKGHDAGLDVFTFLTGDENYDETPWVQQILANTPHRWTPCWLRAEDVPALAQQVADIQDEPYGGLPTLGYVRIFEEARRRGVIVLLDGQGMDEQWCGYDYYRQTSNTPSVVQGSKSAATRPDCLLPEFLSLAQPPAPQRPFGDRLRNLQYRDLRQTKMPRALRYNDRASMQHACELRSPFVDHRLIEFALAQPAHRKIRGPVSKWLPRQLASKLCARGVVEAPKRPLQTPQREWLRTDLRDWADSQINDALRQVGGLWLDEDAVRHAWADYLAGNSDNSFYIWQWLSISMLSQRRTDQTARMAAP